MLEYNHRRRQIAAENRPALRINTVQYNTMSSELRPPPNVRRPLLSSHHFEGPGQDSFIDSQISNRTNRFLSDAREQDSDRRQDHQQHSRSKSSDAARLLHLPNFIPNGSTLSLPDSVLQSSGEAESCNLCTITLYPAHLTFVHRARSKLAKSSWL
jgi:hypothetical protein